MKKCFDTQKAERYFKERKIKYQYIDLVKYGLSKGELESVKASIGLKDLINPKAKEYKELNLQRLGAGSVAKSPIVRNGKQATVGYKPDLWKEWE